MVSNKKAGKSAGFFMPRKNQHRIQPAKNIAPRAGLPQNPAPTLAGGVPQWALTACTAWFPAQTTCVLWVYSPAPLKITAPIPEGSKALHLAKEMPVNRLERLCRIHELLRSAHRPVPMSRFCEALSNTRNTVTRDFQYLKDMFGAPMHSGSSFCSLPHRPLRKL